MREWGGGRGGQVERSVRLRVRVRVRLLWCKSTGAQHTLCVLGGHRT